MILLSLLLVHPVQTLMKCELNAEVESFHDQICNWYNWQAWIIALFFLTDYSRRLWYLCLVKTPISHNDNI